MNKPRPTWYVLREDEHIPIKNRFLSDTNMVSIFVTPVYDEALGTPIGSFEGYKSTESLNDWIADRLAVLGLPPEYYLVSPHHRD